MGSFNDTRVNVSINIFKKENIYLFLKKTKTKQKQISIYLPYFDQSLIVSL